MRRLIAPAAFLALLCLAALGGSPTALQQSSSDSDLAIDRWVRENRRAIEDDLFPSGVIAPENHPKDVRWIVTVRIESAFDGTEIRFSMRRRYDGGVELSVMEPEGATLVAQIRKLRREHPEAGAEAIARLVSLRQRSLTNRDCPGLMKMARDFEAARMSPVLPDVLMMDAYGYDLWSESFYGDRMEVHLQGPGPQAQKQPHTLLAWAEAVRTLVDGRCSGRPAAKAAHEATPNSRP